MNVRSLIFILLCFAGHLYYGLSNNVVDRIIGGSDTDIKEVPWMLSLKSEQLCGAAIINKDWAVTAAHCMVDEDPKNVTVCSGSSNLYKNCTAHKIVNYFIHEDYNNMNYDYDIAVIQVTPAFSYDDYTKPVGLPSTSNMQNKEWGKVCGWGVYQKYSNGEVRPVASENLKCALVPLIECPKDYHVTPRMICYRYQKGGIDSCQGDSGGPLTSDNNLIGITSWGRGCAESGNPGVYTKATRFQDWIENKTGINA